MKHLLDGLDVTPKNIDEIEIIIDKTNEGNNVSLNLTQLIFVNEAKKKIEEYISSHGYFRGIPYQIKLDNGFLMEYFLDQSDEFKIQDYQIEASVKKRFSNIQFWEIVDSTSFDSINITAYDSENITIGRAVVTVDQHLEILILLEKLSGLIRDALAYAYDLGNFIAAASGVGTWIYAIIMIAVLAAKLVGLIGRVYAFVLEVSQFVNPQIENINVITIRNLIKTSLFILGKNVNDTNFLDQFGDIAYVGTCNKSQLALSSNQYGAFSASNLNVYLPVGYPTARDYFDGAKYDFTSVGGFLRWFMASFNAKIKIINDDTIEFHRRDYIDGVVGNITTGLTIQSTRVNEETPNTNENWARCMVQYSLDASEYYTSYMFDLGVNETRVGDITGSGLVDGLNLVKGYKKIDLMFAQGFAYQKQPDIHKNFMELAKTQLSYFGSYSPVEDYIYGTFSHENILVTSHYSYKVPKIVRIIGDNKITQFTTQEIYDEYHDIDFLPNNSYMIHTAEFFECNDDIFVDLYNNDYAEINGEVCQVLRVTYKPLSKKASLIYKKPSNYADTLYKF